jgi:hypothetical protein
MTYGLVTVLVLIVFSAPLYFFIKATPKPSPVVLPEPNALVQLFKLMRDQSVRKEKLQPLTITEPLPNPEPSPIVRPELYTLDQLFANESVEVEFDDEPSRQRPKIETVPETLTALRSRWMRINPPLQPPHLPPSPKVTEMPKLMRVQTRKLK